MPRKNSTQAHINAALRALILKNFNEIRPLTDDEVGDEFLIWDRARRLWPGLEETLEGAEYALLKNYEVVSSRAIGTEYKQADVLRYLTTEETAACLANEYKHCFTLSLVDAHTQDVERRIISRQRGHRRHYPKDPMQPGNGRHHWRRITMQTGVI